MIRGVPLGSDGYFFLPLWTDWRVGPQPGVLDWYTVLSGVVAAAALALHGAHYATLKTGGELNRRARQAARTLWPAVVGLTAASLAATLWIQPSLLDNYRARRSCTPFRHWWRYRWRACGSRGERATSAARFFVLRLPGADAGGRGGGGYPNLLVSTTDPTRNITVYNAHSGCTRCVSG